MGPTSGGYEVVIKGTNLREATEVAFGPARTRPVGPKSSTEIRAIAPPSPESNEGVRVQVITADGQSSSTDCLVLQLRCDDAFFYADKTPLSAGGTKRRIPILFRPGEFTAEGFISIGSWSLRGSLEVSAGDVFPEAAFVRATFSIKDVTIHIRFSGSIGAEEDIPIVLPGLPNGVSLFLRIAPRLSGVVKLDDHIVDDSATAIGGWVGKKWATGRIDCHRHRCFGDPAIEGHVQGSVIVAPWLRVGVDHLALLGGPTVGIAVGRKGILDVCDGLQAKVEGFGGVISHQVNLSGPSNIAGKPRRCPL